LTFILLSSCGELPSQAVPTSTLPPTPDIKAAAAANATLVASKVIGDLEKVLGDTDTPYKAGHLIWQQEDSLFIKMNVRTSGS